MTQPGDPPKGLVITEFGLMPDSIVVQPMDETRAHLTALAERSLRTCHKRGCRDLATKVYTALRGTTEYRYQRCDRHPVRNAVSVEPFRDAAGGSPE